MLSISSYHPGALERIQEDAAWIHKQLKVTSARHVPNGAPKHVGRRQQWSSWFHFKTIEILEANRFT